VCSLFDRDVIASNSTAQAFFFLAETVIAKERSDAPDVLIGSDVLIGIIASD
jgi:hypothetical protein